MGPAIAIPNPRGVNVSGACSEGSCVCENYRPSDSWEDFYGTCTRFLTWTLPAFSLEPGKGMVTATAV